MRSRRSLFLAFGAALAAGAGSRALQTGLGWPTHGGNPAHTAVGKASAQTLSRIVWSTPLDRNPQYSGTVLYAHYGSPVVSDGNVVLLPVKTGVMGGFDVEARDGTKGTLLWRKTTDYVVPSHNWFPTMGPTFVGEYAVYPRKAGIVEIRNSDPRAKTQTVCFYGLRNYQANPAAYDNAVRISSPLVTGDDGSVYFTYRVEGSTPLGLQGGIARIRRDGTATYTEGSVAAAVDYVAPKLNAAPAVSGGTVYAVFKRNGSSDGMMVGLDATTLQPKYRIAMVDPQSGSAAYVDDDGSACPSIAPDGDVYFGVLQNPFDSHHYRGWLLHYDKTLSTTKFPGSFGWDDTPSIVPSALVPSYTGTSSYLIMTKYNNYAGQGDGINRIAIVDPATTQTDAYSTSPVTVMREVLTKVSPTPDPGAGGSYPNAVREWCINTAAIDVLHHSIMVNNEDGVLYRWNLDTNALDQSVRLNDGLGQAYTPTLIGPKGMVYAVSNARLYAVGQ